ncbi:MAG: hypothetical protein K9L28_08630 [Synergistales bacterium]|nr:hypothetical protein [Synergistales bacterium]
MKTRVLFLVAVFVVAGVLWGGLLDIHPFGEPIVTEMDDYFLDNAQEERAVNNIVTAVVFDYRAFDTLGEAAVLFTAVSSVSALFRKGGGH